jgi:hypothetical protein
MWAREVVTSEISVGLSGSNGRGAIFDDARLLERLPKDNGEWQHINMKTAEWGL